MTRALTIGVALVCVASSALAAAPVEPPPRPNTLTVEPLALVLARTITLEYERAITDHVSLYLAPALTMSSMSSDPTDADYLAVGGALGVRVFPVSVAPAGFFIGAMGQLAYAEATRVDAAGEDGAGFERRGAGLGWGVGVRVGYTWLLGGVFDLSIGAGALVYDMTVDVDGENVGDSGVIPTARVAVGLAF